MKPNSAPPIPPETGHGRNVPPALIAAGEEFWAKKLRAGFRAPFLLDLDYEELLGVLGALAVETEVGQDQTPGMGVWHWGQVPPSLRWLARTRKPIRSMRRVLQRGQYVFSSEPVRPGTLPA